MSTPIKDAAYTVVGLNVIAFEQISDAVSDRADEVNDRLGLDDRFSELNDRFENLSGDVNERMPSLPAERFSELNDDLSERWDNLRGEIESQLKQAKKTAKKNTKDLRAKVDPAAERFEARLPYQLARPLEASRVATWDFFGAKAPAKKSTKTTAKKSTAKKTTAKKTTTKKTAAKKAATPKAAAKA